MTSPTTHVIELNEFNLDLLEQAAQELDLVHIQRILSFDQGTTAADQTVEHQGLDPWVQWVSIHAEVPSQEHGVIRLGDVDKLRHQQIWERLAKQNITTGVWGAMNASRRNAATNTFFFADPWTFSEAPYPQKLEQFLALPIYYAKNYLSLSLGKLLKSAFNTASFLLRNIPLPTLIVDGFFLLKNMIGVRPDSCFLFATFELLSARIFTKYRSQSHPDVTFIFLNSIAHFQHHQWKHQGHTDRKTAFLFKSIDRMLGIVLSAATPQDRILVINGLTQKNVADESLYCYRQINPAQFLKIVGIAHARVEQCMTNDGHVFFNTEDERSRAKAILDKATVNGKKAFYVELDPENSCKLFYQVAYWDEADQSTQLQFDDFSLPFFSLFMVHAKRTGAHSSEGNYLVRGAVLPKRVENSKIFSYLWPGY